MEPQGLTTPCLFSTDLPAIVALEVHSPETAHAFRADLSAVAATSRAAIGAQRAKSQDNTWSIWCDFCAEHHVDPLLQAVTDPIPYLQVFAQRYRDGRLAKNGQPVRARTVEDALRAVGQTMASMGAKDHRLEGPNKLEYRLSQLIAGWKRMDPASVRVKPVPLSLIDYGYQMAANTTSKFQRAVVDMSYIGFYYLNRPGEYSLPSQDDALSAPFRLMDVEFSIGQRTFNASTASLADITSATFARLIFTKQKNAVPGEKVGHARSGHAYACPVRALIRRTLALRQDQARPDTPLYEVRENNQTRSVAPHHVTAMLRISAAATFLTVGIDPATISARSLRAGGAMALLCAQVDTDIIRLVGRWRSDEMLRYLHIQAYPLMHTFARAMTVQGSFTLLPGQNIPAVVLPLLDQQLPP